MIKISADLIKNVKFAFLRLKCVDSSKLSLWLPVELYFGWVFFFRFLVGFFKVGMLNVSLTLFMLVSSQDE